MKEWTNPTIDTLDVEVTMGGGYNVNDVDADYWTAEGTLDPQYDTAQEVIDAGFKPKRNLLYNS